MKPQPETKRVDTTWKTQTRNGGSQRYRPYRKRDTVYCFIAAEDAGQPWAPVNTFL